MIKNPVVQAGKDIQKRAKVLASKGAGFGITGTYRKSIGRKSRAMKREGEISATVGIRNDSPAKVYAWRVEGKHHVFTKLEHEFRDPVTKEVRAGLVGGLKKLKIRK